MKKTIAMLVTAIMTLSIATSALPLSVGIRICAATEDNQYVGGAEDTKALQLALPNPDFMDFLENPPDEFYGYIPPPVDLSHLNKIPVQKAQASASSLPSSYDWRDYGKVTPVKDQNPCGTCWDFGATTVLESAVLIGENVAYDFSEQSVALCVDRSWVYLYDDWDDPCNGGGWGWLASEVFIKKGSVLESCNPYDASALNCDGTCVCDTCPSIKKVDGYRLATNDGSQIDVIKNAVYNHEPVTVTYQHNSIYLYDDPTWGYIHDNYPCYGGANHLVSIIGWDDAVPHPNPDHGGTGAWIVKNSWGTGWGNNGFFYLAYDSSCVNGIAYLEYKDPVPGEELLYWDEAGHVGSAGYGDNEAWMASVFTANQDSDLTHVDFWTTSNNAQYEIYVWDGFFGTQLAHQTGTCQEYGYYSIPLSAPISRNAGQQFTVGVTMTTPGYNYPMAVEYESTGTVEPPIQTGVSFARHTGSDSWADLAGSNRNACLRARIVGEAPDIYVDPTSFDVTLPPNTTWSDILDIGNDGEGTLTYDITDVETTSPPSLVFIPASNGNFKRDSAPVSIGRAPPVSAATTEGPAIPTEFVLSSGEPAFAMDIINENMVYIPDTTAPGTWNIVGATPGTSYFAGDFLNGDFSKMYVLDYYNNTLSTVDTTTAAATLIGPSAPVSGHVWTGMTGATDGTLYASSSDITMSYLYTIDPANGAPTVVEEITNGPAIIDIAINANGEMYGVDIVNDVLVEIDPATGAGTVIGLIGFDANFAQGMDFEEVSGVLYLAAYSSSDGELRIADTSTGNTVLVGAFPDNAETDCLAFPTFGAECPWLDENPETGDVEPGNSDEITVSIDTTGLAPGEYSAKIYIANNDPDENPTVVPVQLTVIVALPDLVITEKWVCWPDNCTICYNVTNIGIGTAPAGHNTTLYVNGNETAHDQVPVDLAPNESYTGCFNDSSWIYTPPDDNITVCADSNKTVNESDEGNNCLTNIWKCGDVDGNSYINMADVGLLWPHVYYPGDYPINEWAGDVDGNGYMTMADVGLLWPHVYYPDVYPLNCRCS